jgi:hypothetical protein
MKPEPDSKTKEGTLLTLIKAPSSAQCALEVYWTFYPQFVKICNNYYIANKAAIMAKSGDTNDKFVLKECEKMKATVSDASAAQANCQMSAKCTV